VSESRGIMSEENVTSRNEFKIVQNIGLETLTETIKQYEGICEMRVKMLDVYAEHLNYWGYVSFTNLFLTFLDETVAVLYLLFYKI
jgi:hypothetical protein